MNKGMVSVIIPTYNRADYIERAIDSVLLQTYTNFEIIIVDDNNQNSISRKEMLKKISKYSIDNRVKYIMHEENKNGAAARNTGISVAKGEYITFLDDDDYFLPNRLEHMVKEMKKGNLMAAYSSLIVVKDKKIQLIKVANKKGNLQLDILKQKSFFGTGSNMFFKSKAIKKINGFDESFVRHQDLEFFVRFFELYEISPVNDFLVVKNNDDRSNTLNLEKAIKCRKQFLDTYRNIIEKYDSKEIKDIYKNNFMDLMKLSVRTRNLSNIKFIESEMSKYNCQLSMLDIIKLGIIYLDSFFHLKIIKTKFENYKKKKLVNKTVFEYINSIERKKS